MIIGVCGFGETGSGAVLDYLKEFNTVNVKDDLEFTYLTSVDGMLYLERALMNPFSRTSDSIWGIKRYLDMAEKWKSHYQGHGLSSDVFMNSVRRFIDSITMVKWYWNYKSYSFTSIYFLHHFVLSKIIPRIERKTGKRSKCWPLKEVCFSVKPKNFYDAAQKHIDELFNEMRLDQYSILCLDQPFAANNPQACFPFLKDPYAIIVDRDPRDLYVSGKTKLMGQWHFFPIEPVEDFITYYKALRDNQPYRQIHPRVLSLRFEDLIYEYDKTTERIQNFLHLPENPHPRTWFDPSRSIANTQVFKRYPSFADDVKKIEKALPEYLFDFSGYPEPDFKQEMFLWSTK